jgi:SAM-dependent methyltransferase
MRDHSHPEHGDVVTEQLELDGVVFSSYLADAVAWVGGLASDLRCERILDLGSGTGNASVALAKQFPGAAVLAVDDSAELLNRLAAKAVDEGLTGRISILRADLDGRWPEIDQVDVVWASMSLHHLTDPDRVLNDVFAGIRPGGLLAVAEMSSLPRFLTDETSLGRPGLESRCRTALRALQATSLPHLGSDWSDRLSEPNSQTSRSGPFPSTWTRRSRLQPAVTPRYGYSVSALT